MTSPVSPHERAHDLWREMTVSAVPGTVTIDALLRSAVDRTTLSLNLMLAGYVRISKADLLRIQEDPSLTVEERDRLGVERQRTDIFNLAPIRGHRVGEHVFEDNNLSAADPDIYRPQFEQMLIELAEGRWGGIICYNIDRLARQPADLERVIAIYEKAEKDGKRLAFITVEADYDLSTSDGRLHARSMVNYAKKSSEDTARRIRRKNVEKATKGQRPAGRPPIWLKADGTLNPDIAPHMIEAINMARKPDGGGAVAIADFLWSKGIGTTPVRNNRKGGGVTREPGPFGPAAIYYMFANPALCGIARYRGNLVTNAEGSYVSCGYKALIEPGEWFALQNAMAKRRLKQTRPRSSYCLTGLVRCALCNTKMVGHATQHTSRRTGEVTTVRGYFCSPSNRGCGKCHRKAETLEAYVVANVIEHVANNPVGVVGEPIDTEWPGAAELTELMSDIRELNEAKAARRIKMASFIRQLEMLEIEQDRLLAEQAAHARQTIPVEPIDTDIIARFDEASPDRQHALIARVLSAVVVKPGVRGKKTFDKTLVELVPRAV